ncbi:hypothetical protein [Sphingomonas sp.]|jgi:hypothetical protein|uniref:hypothetical protein n=1 Tax=Sphingomonas sp. TaxID=28214 RepID=UPI002EDAF6EB
MGRFFWLPPKETVRADQRSFDGSCFTAGPEVGDRLERTNVFAAGTVAKQNVEREHWYSPIGAQ